MSDDPEIPEPDRAGEAPHPRLTEALFGQAEAEAQILEAMQSGRLHHGWLLTGPRGVGKATLAWRIARTLIAQPPKGGMFPPEPPRSLEMDPMDPVFRRCAALSEPRLKLIRRGWDDKLKRLRTRITVDDVRALREFTGLSAADGGWRAVIIDPVDEMNPAAANAVLKMLEEPPADCVFLLISHAPARLLPTIRSRCRKLALKPLNGPDLADAARLAMPDAEPPDPSLAALSGGSVGEALRLAAAEGPMLYGQIVSLFRNAPGIDRNALHMIAEQAVGPGSEPARDALGRLGALFAQRLARAAALGIIPPEAAAGEAKVIERLASSPHQAPIWAEAATAFSARLDHALGVNLDPVQAFLDTFLALDAAAGRATGR